MVVATQASALETHLAGGSTTLCRVWAIDRRDGVSLGFTDHDCDLGFDGMTFRADSGLTAMALQQGTGLSVDNTEALGVLSDASISEADIEAGRFDGAEVRAWLVNWADTEQRILQFRGAIGELRRKGGAFEAELRGLTELLNRPLGRVYQKPCTAVLGDGQCRFDLGAPGYSAEVGVVSVDAGVRITLPAMPGFDAGWFARGRLKVLSGHATGLGATIKSDRLINANRVVELWHPLRAALAPGDLLRLDAGCDKRFDTCRLKFLNQMNFQGFPDIPGEDWVVAQPKSSGSNSGGSLR